MQSIINALIRTHRAGIDKDENEILLIHRTSVQAQDVCCTWNAPERRYGCALHHGEIGQRHGFARRNEAS